MHILSTLWTLIIWLVLPVMVVLIIFKRHKTKLRLNNYRNRQTRNNDQDKIIIGCQIVNLFVKISDMYHPGYHSIQRVEHGVEKYWTAFKKIFGYGLYYKLKEDKKDIKNFIQTLASNNNVELYLYTSLDREIADLILKRLELSKFFPEDRRRSCIDFGEIKKHPTQIDSNTKRVIILTGTKNDHAEQDNKYFLIMKQKQLKEYGKILTNLIQMNQDIDQLHNELSYIKIEIQSDYQSSKER